MIFGTPLDSHRLRRRSHINEGAKLIHIDLDGRESARTAAPTSASSATRASSWRPHHLRQRSRWKPEMSRAWLGELRALEERKWDALRPQLASDEAPLNPLRVCAEVDRLLTPDTIVIGDGGDFVGSAANVLRPRGFGHWLDAGPLGTLAPAPLRDGREARVPSRMSSSCTATRVPLNMMEFEACIRQKINIVGVVGTTRRGRRSARPGADVRPRPDAGLQARAEPHDLMIEALGGHGEWVERPEQVRPAPTRPAPGSPRW
jgi:acetolactate synthase-1/2/3 large subunit